MFKLSKTPPSLSKSPGWGGGGAVFRNMDKAIHWINYYPKDQAQLAFVILILWIAIYPVDSATQPLNNRVLYREFEQEYGKKATCLVNERCRK